MIYAQHDVYTLPVVSPEVTNSDVTAVSLPEFEGGLFAAMSTNGTFSCIAGPISQKERG